MTSTPQKSYWILGTFIAILIFITFGRSLFYPFIVLDDLYYLSQNKMILAGLNPESLTWAFTTFETGDWQPVTWLSWMIPAIFWGLSPVAAHLINVLFHAANAVFLFFILKKYTGTFWRAALTALFFAVHPLRVESVVWAAERKDVLAGFFFMLVLNFYYKYTQKPSWLKMSGICGIYLLGLMSKPVLVTLPFILILLDYWPLGRFERQKKAVLFFEKIPVLLLSLFSCVMTLLAARASIMPLEKISFSLRIINAVISYGEYLKKTIIPFPLAHFYPHPMADYSIAMLIFSSCALTAGTVWAVYRRKKEPYAFTGWLWFLVMLLPSAGWVQVGRAAMADRYTYLPHIGLFLAALWFLHEKISGFRSLKIYGAVLVLIFLSSVSFIQTGYWKDSETLDRHTLSVTGYNPIVQSNLNFAVIQNNMKNNDVDALMNFFAETSRVQIPSEDPS